MKGGTIMWNRQETGGLRDIIARTTCAKGQKRFKQTFTLHATHLPDGILGYRVMNHSFVASPERHSVEVTGQYDLHVWYAYNGGSETVVERKTVCYSEHLPVIDLEGVRLGVNECAQATVIKEPRIACIHLRHATVEATVAVEFYAEVVGEARLWVRVYEPPSAVDEKKDLDFVDDEEFLEFEEDDELVEEEL